MSEDDTRPAVIAETTPEEDAAFELLEAQRQVSARPPPSYEPYALGGNNRKTVGDGKP